MKQVLVPGLGQVAFPDDMSDADIAGVIRKQIGSDTPPEPGKLSQIASGLKNMFGIGEGNTVRGLGEFTQAPVAGTQSWAANLRAGVANIDDWLNQNSLTKWATPQAAEDARDQEIAERVARTRQEATDAADAALAARTKAREDDTFLGRVGGTMEDAGRDLQRHYSEQLPAESPMMLRQQQAIQDADGFWDTTKALVTNPLGSAGIAAQSAPDMLVGMGFGRVAAGVAGLAMRQAAAKAAERVGRETLLKAAANPATFANANKLAQQAAGQAYSDTLNGARAAAAGGVGNVAEGLQSGFSTGAQIKDDLERVDPGTGQPAISDEALAQHNPRFAELLADGHTPSYARKMLAAELSDRFAPAAALWTMAAGRLSGAAEAEGQLLTRTGRPSWRTTAQNIGKEGLEEAMQNPGEDYSQWLAKEQYDPNNKPFDLGGSVAQGLLPGLGMGAGMHGSGHALSLLHAPEPAVKLAGRPIESFSTEQLQGYVNAGVLTEPVKAKIDAELELRGVKPGPAAPGAGGAPGQGEQLDSAIQRFASDAGIGPDGAAGAAQQPDRAGRGAGDLGAAGARQPGAGADAAAPGAGGVRDQSAALGAGQPPGALSGDVIPTAVSTQGALQEAVQRAAERRRQEDQRLGQQRLDAAIAAGQNPADTLADVRGTLARNAVQPTSAGLNADNTPFGTTALAAQSPHYDDALAQAQQAVQRASSEAAARGQPLPYTPNLSPIVNPQLAHQANAVADMVHAVFGVRSVMYHDAATGAPDGFMLHGRSYVNAGNLEQALHFVAFHESFHVAEQQAANGDANAQRFVKTAYSIFDMMSDKGKRAYAERFLFKHQIEHGGVSVESLLQADPQRGSPAWDLRSEMIADFFGKRATDIDFLRHLAKRQPATFGDFARRWIDSLSSMIDALRGRGKEGVKDVDQHIRRLSRAKAVAASALIEWRKANPAAAAMVPAAGTTKPATRRVLAPAAGAPVIQNRDRSTPGAIAQMQSIAARPDYTRLGFSRDFTSGAPVVSGGNIAEDQLGHRDMAAAGERHIPVRYAVVEAGDVSASHDVSGNANPGYAAGGGAITAVAGNGRIAGLQGAYRNGTAGPYRAQLQEDKLHGIDPRVIADMTAPVLVRVMPASEVTADIGDVSNTRGTLDLSAVEQARNDARRVNLGALEFAEDGSMTPQAVRRFVQAMPQAEQASLIDTDGSPTRQAVDRLNAAIFSAAYDSDALVRLYAQATDPEARNVMSALAQAAPGMARLRGAGALDIRELIAQAAEQAVNARRRGIKLTDMANQADLNTDPDVRRVLELFAQDTRSVKPTVEALRRASDFAYAEATKDGTDMFGAVQRASRADVLDRLRPDHERSRTQAVEKPGRAAPAGQDAGGHPGGPARPGHAAADEAGRSAQDAAAPDQGLRLTAQTEGDLRDKASREAAAHEADQREQRRLADKAKADAERGGFTLTGSDRTADVAAAAGQTDIFASPPTKQPEVDAVTAAASRGGAPGNARTSSESRTLLDPRATYDVARAESSVYPINSLKQNFDVPTDLFPETLSSNPRVDRGTGPERTGLRGNVQPAPELRKTVLAVREDAHFPGVYHYSTQLVEVGRRELPVKSVTNWQEAASALAAMGRYAVEHFDVLLTDAKGKPLAVVGAFKGHQTQTSVYPSTILTEALRVKGATRAWAVHNHPSGAERLSSADEHMSGTLGRVFDPSSIEWMGLSAIGRDRFMAIQKDATVQSGALLAGKSVVSIPVVERTIMRANDAMRTMDNPQVASEVVRRMTTSGKPGIVMMDAQNRVSAWVPIDPVEMGALRKDGRFDRLINSVSNAGAAAAILANPNGALTERTINNIGSALKLADIRVLDVIDPVSGKSMAETVGLPSMSGPVLSRKSEDLGPERIGQFPASPEGRALQALSRNDDLFALPRPTGTTVQQIARQIDPQIQVIARNIPGERRFDLVMPDGKTARLIVRKPNPYGPTPYGFHQADGELNNVVTDRPGDNPEHVPQGTEEVYIDASLLAPGSGGAKVYAIASAFAHNTDRIFIGDPAGLSDEAMRRRSENMLSSALRFGTTRHLAPHPRQLAGDKSLGVPPLRWVYGDDQGNIRRLIDLNLKALENAGLDDSSIRFDPGTGNFLDSADQPIDRNGIDAVAASMRSRDDASGHSGVRVQSVAGDAAIRSTAGALAGGRTLARGAVLRALLREEGAGSEAGGRRDGLLARLARLGSDAPQALKWLFSRQAEDTSAPADVPAIKRMVETVSATWRADGPSVFVAGTVADLPPGVRNSLELMGATSSVQAMMMPGGDVYLVADRLGTIGRAQMALFHEVYGHWGLRQFLGASYDTQMALLRLANPQLAEEAGAWLAQYGRDEVDARVKKGMDLEAARRQVRALSVEEALSDRAGRGDVPKGWQRLMARLQKALRDMGLGRVADRLETMTEAETFALLGDARRAVHGRPIGGPHVLADAHPALSRQGGDGDAEAQLRDTERAYGGQEAYGRAKADGRTKLGYRQWVQVRMPNFKAWFGDWEAARARRDLESMTAVPSDFAAAHDPDFSAAREAARTAYNTLRADTERHGFGVVTPDGRQVKFSGRGFKEVAAHGADRRVLAVAANLRSLFEASVPMYSTLPSRDAQQVRAFHYYATKADFGRDGEAFVLLEVIERTSGEFFYDADATSVEEARAATSAPLAGRPKAEAGGVGAARIGRLSQWMAAGNIATVSKVTDPDTGEPMVVYHGTQADFDEFRTSGLGAHFTGDASVASAFGEEGSVLPVYVRIRNPLRIADHGGHHDDAKGVAEALIDAGTLPADYLGDHFYSRLMADDALGNTEKYLANNKAEIERMRGIVKAQGYDGIVYRNTAEGGGDSYIAFRPEQIKSSIGNTGAFDATNPDIRYSIKHGALPGVAHAENQADYASLLGKALASPADSRAQIGLPLVSKPMQALGVAPKTQVVSRDVLQKMHFEHGLTRAELTRLPDLLASPMMILRNPSQAGRWLVVTTLVKNGSPVLISIDPHGQVGRVELPVLKTGFAKDDPDTITRYLKQNTAAWVSKEESRQFSTTTGRQLPGVVQRASGFSPKYLTEKDAPASGPEWTDVPHYSRKFGPDVPEETTLEAGRRQAQDQHLRMRTLREWAAANGVKMSEASDAYAAEERMHGRQASRIQDFREKTIRPLVQATQASGFTMEQVEDYLHAQHAEERNKQIAKINEHMPDGGSGMSTADARAALAAAPPGLAALANRWQAITDQTRDILLNAGIINQDTVNAWAGAYKHYVPLKGGEDDAAARTGIGKGLSVNGRQKRAMGHDERAGGEHVIGNILRDHERAIVLAEKNRVGQAMLLWLKELDDPRIGTVDKPVKRAVLKPSYSFDVRLRGLSVQSFDSEADARRFVLQQMAVGSPGAQQMKIVKEVADRNVQYMAMPMLDEHEAQVYVAGHAVRLQLNDPLLARSYKRLGADQMSSFIASAREVNTYLSKAYTGYNPAFIPRNMIRDFGSGLVKITGNFGAGITAKTLARYPQALGTLLRYSVTGRTTQDIDQYRAHGGSTGAAYLSDLDRVGKNVQHDFERYQGVMQQLADRKHLAAARVASSKLIGGLAGWIEHLNMATENAMRLAVFQAVRDSGQSIETAASAAKNSTINFNRRGEMGQTLGALYLFYNPNMQDTASVIETLTRGKNKYQAQALVAAMAGISYLLAALQFGQSDDDYERWKKISDNVRDRNLILRTGEDTYISIPVPFGFGFFHTLGNTMFMAQRGENFNKLSVGVAANLLDHFSPVGNPLQGAQGWDKVDKRNFVNLVPGVGAGDLTRDAARMMVNRNAFGGDIVPDSKFDEGRPDNLRMYRGTKGSAYDAVTSFLNQATGGTASMPGYIDVSPETLKFWTSALTGGTGTFLYDVSHLAGLVGRYALSTDDNKEALLPDRREVPILRDYSRQEDVHDARRAYWEAVKEAEATLTDFNRARRMMDHEAANKILQDNREALQLANMSRSFGRMVKYQRDRVDKINADETSSLAYKRAAIKQLERAETQIYDRYLDAVTSAESRREQRTQAQ